MGRAIAGGVSVVVAAGVGVVTALVTAHPSTGLWVALGVLAIVGAVLQVVVIGRERGSPHRIIATGPGAIAVGGSARKIRTRVRGKAMPSDRPEGDGVAATGAGAVSVGGDITECASTDVSSSDE